MGTRSSMTAAVTVQSYPTAADRGGYRVPRESLSARGNRACDSVFLAERSTRSILDTCSWPSGAARNAGSIRSGFIPAGTPPHKAAESITPGNQRAEMLEFAIAGHPQFSVNRMELAREGRSFTVDTLRQLHAEDPSRELFFLIGADSLADLPLWRDPAGNCRAGDDRRRQPGRPADARSRGAAEQTRRRGL